MNQISSFVVICFAISATLIAKAAEPFAVSLPKDFSGPAVSSFGSAEIFTYIRATDDPAFRCLFIVTITPIPESEKQDPLTSRLDQLMRGIEGRRTGLKKTAYVKRTLGGLEAISVDWEGANNGRTVKGRTICTVDGGTLVHVTLQDLPEAWERGLPELEKALATFTLKRP